MLVQKVAIKGTLMSYNLFNEDGKWVTRILSEKLEMRGYVFKQTNHRGLRSAMNNKKREELNINSSIFEMRRLKKMADI